MVRIGINGFGRIGRAFLRVSQAIPELQVVAINDLMDINTAAHLFAYDSVHRAFLGEVNVLNDKIHIDGFELAYTQVSEPDELNWEGVDLVLESTGKFKTLETAGVHMENGASKVLISSPPADDLIQSVCYGINDLDIDWTVDVLSNASCTTNSAAPLVKVLESIATIDAAYITTVHSYTTDQRLQDSPHQDLRRARAAALSIVPTTTGAAKAITKVFPHLEGRIGGCGIRVPVPDGSLTDMTFIVKESLNIEEVNAAFKKASEESLSGVLQYLEIPLVSSDIIGNTHSCIYDSLLTSVVGNMVKIVGWYDNEMGYSNRLADVALRWFNENR